MSQPSVLVALADVADHGAPGALLRIIDVEQRTGLGDHGHGQSGDLVARHPRAALLRLAGHTRTELVAIARPDGRARLARRDDDHLPGRGPFPRPEQLQHVVHGRAVHRQIPYGTVVAVRDRAHAARDLVRGRVPGRRRLRRARDALGGHLTTVRAGVHRARLFRVLADVGAR